jgi:nucleoside transporter
MSIDHAAARTPTGLRYRLCVMMFLQYFVQGSYLPVITEYLRSGLDFTPGQIGTFSAAIAVGPLVAPFFFGQLVDRHLATEKVLAVCHLCGGAIMLALYSIEAYVPIVVLGVLYSTLYVPSMMLTNSLSFHHLADREREFPLIRLWGTIGFVVPAWWVEMVFLRGLEGPQLDKARGIVLAFAGFGGLVMGLYCLTLPHTPPSKSDKKDLAPGKVLRLLRHRNFAVLVGVSLIVAIVHKHYFVWAAPFLRTVLDSVGIAAAIEGRIMSLGQIAEVVVFALLGLLLKRLGFKRVMVLGAFAYLLRCVLFAWAITIPGGEATFAAQSWAMSFTANGPAKLIFTLLVVGQMLHGLCFGCFLAAAYIYVDKVAPPDVRGSMQTFYGTFIVGAGLFLGGFVSGWLGGIFETAPGEGTIRSALGITTTTGLVEFTRMRAGQEVTVIADWPGIWLSGGAIALVALVLFAILFPRRQGDEPQQAA